MNVIVRANMFHVICSEVQKDYYKHFQATSDYAKDAMAEETWQNSLASAPTILPSPATSKASTASPLAPKTDH